MAKVYFIKDINEENIVKMYKMLKKDLKGNVAIKVHSGEAGNQNYLHPEFYRDIVDYVHGTVVECNTAYDGERNTTEKHLKHLEKNNWNKYFNFDLLDQEDDDLVLDIPNGKILKENYVGKNLIKYDSMLVISHFKGHPMGGYGGALKQLSIGCSSSKGKAWIHSAGVTKDPNVLWNHIPKQELFLESMADAASSIVNHFNGNMAFINVMCNISVDCDCVHKAEDPCMKDIGILASLDPVSIDQACIDLIYNSTDPGAHHLIERIESRKGIHTIEAASDLGVGSREYELIEVK